MQQIIFFLAVISFACAIDVTVYTEIKDQFIDCNVQGKGCLLSAYYRCVPTDGQCEWMNVDIAKHECARWDNCGAFSCVMGRCRARQSTIGNNKLDEWHDAISYVKKRVWFSEISGYALACDILGGGCLAPDESRGCTAVSGQCQWPGYQVALEECSKWSECSALHCAFDGVCYARRGATQNNRLQPDTTSMAYVASLAHKHLGCWKDDIPFAMMGDDLSDMVGMNADLCVGFCAGYKYAGLGDSNWCFCGNQNYAAEGADVCDEPCEGDPTQMCGGGFKFNYYQVEAYPHLGCWTDDTSHALPDASKSDSRMTIEMCANFCEGYDLFGVQSGTYCYCGNSGYTQYGASTGCDTACGGDSTTICGGTLAQNVYSLELTSIHIGCWKNAPNPALIGRTFKFGGMTLEECETGCSEFDFFAVMGGDACFCGDTGFDIYGPSDDCNTPCSGNSEQMCGGYWSQNVYRRKGSSTKKREQPKSGTESGKGTLAEKKEDPARKGEL